MDHMDDDATIIAFLKAYGYQNVTAIDVDKIRFYMINHGLLHVEQLVQ